MDSCVDCWPASCRSMHAYAPLSGWAPGGLQTPHHDGLWPLPSEQPRASRVQLSLYSPSQDMLLTYYPASS